MNQHLKHYNQTHTRMNENIHTHAAMKHAHTHARAQFTQTPKFLQYKDRDTF